MKEPPAPCRGGRSFDAGNPVAERATRRVVALASVMMVGEIGAGWWSGSMALLADGWHMGTHVGALGIAAAAYWLARRHSGDARFTFGTWKFEVLGGFASAIVLGLVAVAMAVESGRRLFVPGVIHYDEALAVAVLGLVVNLVSAWLLEDRPAASDGGGADLNLRGAYFHVLADALTSVAAIVALGGGRSFGWSWLDPVMGIVGSAVVAVWAVALLRQTGAALLDREAPAEVVSAARAALVDGNGVRVTDLHVWPVGKGRFACVAAVVDPGGHSAAELRARLGRIAGFVHVTLEIERGDERSREAAVHRAIGGRDG